MQIKSHLPNRSPSATSRPSLIISKEANFFKNISWQIEAIHGIYPSSHLKICFDLIIDCNTRVGPKYGSYQTSLACFSSSRTPIPVHVRFFPSPQVAWRLRSAPIFAMYCTRTYIALVPSNSQNRHIQTYHALVQYAIF